MRRHREARIGLVVRLLLLTGGLTTCGMTPFASGHGPVFGLATPTNGKRGWSLDIGTMDRVGTLDTSAMGRVVLG